MQNFRSGERFYFHELTGGTDNGEFSLKVFANGVGPSASYGGPADLLTVKAKSSPIGDGATFTASPRSVLYILIEHEGNVTK
jgi:hypothetical protein